jgi:hypothetical protein
MGGRVWARGGGRCGGQWASQVTAAGTSTGTPINRQANRVPCCTSLMLVASVRLSFSLIDRCKRVWTCRSLVYGFTERLPACLPARVCVYLCVMSGWTC